MRKYFLLSAVALLATSTANATTDYAEVTAKATIEVAGTVECGEIDLGTIVMKANNASSTVRINTYEYTSTGDVLSVSDYSIGDCSFERAMLDSDLPTSVTLTGEESGKTVSLTDLTVLEETTFEMTLNIPDNIAADNYFGSFTIAIAYE